MVALYKRKGGSIFPDEWLTTLRNSGFLKPEYSLVADYVAEKKKQLYSGEQNFYLPLKHIAGEAQFDFGVADFFEDGIRYSGHFLNLSFPQSNGGYLQLFKGENLQCIMEGLKNIFAHVSGVPQRIWFDNPSTLVSKILKNGERTLTDAFQRFKNHYGFTAAFCNPYSGHEKGSVENKVGYHRRNFLVPVPRFEDLRQYNQQLLQMCDADMLRPHYQKGTYVKDLFQADLENLLLLPAVELDESQLVTIKTNSYAKFTLNKGKHTYSTAPMYASTTLWARLTAHEVIVLDENYQEVKKHPRLYSDQKESMDWLPYLTQLARRPAALKYTGIYDLFPQGVKDFFSQNSPQEKKETLRILAQISEETGFNYALEALQIALKHGAKDPDSVLATFSRLNTDVFELEPIVLPASTPELPSFKPQVENYDQFLMKGGVEGERTDC